MVLPDVRPRGQNHYLLKIAVKMFRGGGPKIGFISSAKKVRTCHNF